MDIIHFSTDGLLIKSLDITMLTADSSALPMLIEFTKIVVANDLS